MIAKDHSYSVSNITFLAGTLLNDMNKTNLYLYLCTYKQPYWRTHRWIIYIKFSKKILKYVGIDISVTAYDLSVLLPFFFLAFVKLEEIKNYVASKYIMFRDSLSCLQALQSMKLERPLIGMVIRNGVFLNFDRKDIIFWGGT